MTAAPFAPAPYAAALRPDARAEAAQAEAAQGRRVIIRALRLATAHTAARMAATVHGADLDEMLAATPWRDLDGLAAEAQRAVPAAIDCRTPEGRALADVHDAAMRALASPNRAARSYGDDA